MVIKMEKLYWAGEQRNGTINLIEPFDGDIEGDDIYQIAMANVLRRYPAVSRYLIVTVVI